MTKGKIGKSLILFAIPLLLGNLLQQLYNAVDAVVVGNFVGPQALAAVGITSPLINMIISFFMGMSSGSSVMVSQYFGAKDEKNLHRTIHTAMLLAFLIGVFLSAVGVLASPALLKMMNTPSDMLESANSYLRIYFAGLTGLTVYNMGAAILTAIGDSKSPLYFLMISTVLNTFGDLLFVTYIPLGVAGAALATIIAEAISAILVVVVLCRTKGAHRLELKKLHIERGILKQISKVGLPAAIQQAIISGSNIVVLSYVNGLGMVAAAGYAAANKLDAFLPLPVQTMALAVTTFVAQNLGAGNVERARKGTKYSILIGTTSTIFLSTLAMVFHDRILRIFSSDSKVLAYGWEFLRANAPFYFFLSGTQILPGALRGSGDIKTATVACVGSFVVVRQIYLFFITKFFYNATVIMLGYPITWLLAAIIITVHYRHSDWSRYSRAV